MGHRIRLATAAAVSALGLLAATGVADAASISVQQSPARATGVSGMVVPSVYSVGVRADTAAPGSVSISADAGPAACATTISRALLRVDWTNPTARTRGTVVVKACDNGYNPDVPVRAVARTGAGAVKFTSLPTGSRDLATAGQPAFPGGGTFTVR